MLSLEPMVILPAVGDGGGGDSGTAAGDEGEGGVGGVRELGPVELRWAACSEENDRAGVGDGSGDGEDFRRRERGVARDEKRGF